MRIQTWEHRSQWGLACEPAVGGVDEIGERSGASSSLYPVDEVELSTNRRS